jgi:hypothetical protein
MLETFSIKPELLLHVFCSSINLTQLQSQEDQAVVEMVEVPLIELSTSC